MAKPDIDPVELLNQLAALKAQMEEMRAAPVQSVGINADQLESMLSRVTKAASAGSELLASKLKPENADHLHRGPFEHPEGGITFPKDQMPNGKVEFGGFHRKEIVFAGRIMRMDELSYFEAMALNELSASLGRGQRRIARNGKWKAEVRDDDERMLISVPMKTIDDRQDLPSFMEIVRELTTGTRQQDPGELAQEVMLLKQQIALLMSKAGAAGSGAAA